MFFDLLTITCIACLGGWIEWRFRQLGHSEAGPLFPCYYCGHMYPIFRRNRIGNYDYCPEHGDRRKKAVLAEMKQESRNDNRVGLRPAHSGSEQPNNNEFPWLS